MTETRQHKHCEEFSVSAEQLFQLLVAPSAIRQWWSASRAIVLPQTGGIWTAAWGDAEDEPDYITAATIRDFEPPRRLVLGDFQYFAKSGPLPFEADFTTEFLVDSGMDGATLEVIQRGFPCDPAADEYFAACQQGWRDTFAGIRKYLETLPG